MSQNEEHEGEKQIKKDKVFLGIIKLASPLKETTNEAPAMDYRLDLHYINLEPDVKKIIPK